MTAITFDLTKSAIVPAVASIQSLASSATLLAGAQSAVVTLSSDLNLEYMVEWVVKGNASAPTAGTLGELRSFFSEDGTNYEGGGIITAAGSAAKTLTEGEKQQGALIDYVRFEAVTNQVIQITRPLLSGRPGRLTIPKTVVFWVTQASGLALAATVNAISVYPRNFV